MALELRAQQERGQRSKHLGAFFLRAAEVAVYCFSSHSSKRLQSLFEQPYLLPLSIRLDWTSRETVDSGRPMPFEISAIPLPQSRRNSTRFLSSIPMCVYFRNQQRPTTLSKAWLLS